MRTADRVQQTASHTTVDRCMCSQVRITFFLVGGHCTYMDASSITRNILQQSATKNTMIEAGLYLIIISFWSVRPNVSP